MKTTPNNHGFAMILVLVMLATSAVIGMTYLASSQVRLSTSQNAVNSGRAQYLAESGLEHARYVLAERPDLLEAACAAPQGPFRLDGDDGAYTFRAVRDAQKTGYYYVTAEATASGVTRQSTMTAVRSSTSTMHDITHGLMATSGDGCILPQSLELQGDVSVRGIVINWSRVRGTIYGDSSIWDIYGLADQIRPYSASVPPAPVIEAADYESYTVGGVRSTAMKIAEDRIRKHDAFLDGKAITAGNPGGVVYVTPESGRLRIEDNVRFTGTLVVEGDLELSGSNVHLTAPQGFPAIVATGTIILTRSTDAVIDGLVVAGTGMGSTGNQPQRGELTINGGVVSPYGVLYGTRTQIQLTHVRENCQVYNFHGGASAGQAGSATVRIISTN